MQDQSPRSFNDDEIDLVKLFQSLFKQKFLILAVAALVTLMAAAYAFLATPHYQVQSILRPVDRGSLDELNSTGVYELTPSEALSRVGSGLSSYENRLAFFRDHQALFSGLIGPNRSLEQAFEAFNRTSFTMLQVDPKKTAGQSEFVGLSLTYPRGVEGVEVINGFVTFVLDTERARIDSDLQVLVANRLLNIEQKINAARASYAASKEARIAALLEQDTLTRAQLQDELRALRGELKTRRQSRIAVLDEAIQIAESLGIENPTTPSSMSESQRQGQVVRTEVNSREIPLYFMGSAALKAEREALNARRSDDFIEPRIAEIEKELTLLNQNRQVEILEKRQNEDLYLKDLAEWRQEAAQLKGIKFDTSALKLVRLDQQALEPLAPVKPKKAMIIALGGVGGLMLGFFVALLRNLVRPRRQMA
ncbi:Wzz/FepE/Etk N-terminal domain-containing protein [Pseudomonas sp. MMS21-TM103]|uniref:Wzz/FepE/Etk N-terminal domain-containing protein n=1 Tax=Pseudomonas sp. MMS21 TM103 TaxID=2886506 RepID=UPI001EDF99C7|nr:Wzz/FepE/Etk N-terminal domain-containing protein [Pseudomonas sp. MMS21 TM103]MCG4455182.1 Wzz/FepE/Etk N-terminal domain-containing protein [Pseudomonas sp. MMS21 TM103]